MATDQGADAPVDENLIANDELDADLGVDENPDGSSDNPADDEEEFEEVEREGRKYRVPKALAPELMLHADYTRKTQELGEGRKAIEADRQKLAQEAQNQQAFIGEVAKLHALADQLKEYENANWSELRQKFGNEAVADAQFQYAQLQRQFAAIKSGLDAKVAQRQQEASAAQAKELQERDASLAREIPGFTPQLRTELENIAIANGFSPEEVKLADVRSFKMLKLIRDGMAALEREKRAKRVQQGSAVQPASNPRGSAPRPGPSDKDSTDDWMRKRQAELAAKRAKAGKR